MNDRLEMASKTGFLCALAGFALSCSFAPMYESAFAKIKITDEFLYLQMLLISSVSGFIGFGVGYFFQKASADDNQPEETRPLATHGAS